MKFVCSYFYVKYGAFLWPLICSGLGMLTSNDKKIDTLSQCIVMHFITQIIAMKFSRGRCVNTYFLVKTYWPRQTFSEPNLERGYAFIFSIHEKMYCWYYNFAYSNLFSLRAGQIMFLLCCSFCALSLWIL